ncbi:MAG TPA: hypothetical protein VEZ59_08960, partial [Sphingopyxis sp.]|nr:hypothetical protein [Sphingopyxis sp.]
ACCPAGRAAARAPTSPVIAPAIADTAPALTNVRRDSIAIPSRASRGGSGPLFPAGSSVRRGVRYRPTMPKFAPFRQFSGMTMLSHRGNYVNLLYILYLEH